MKMFGSPSHKKEIDKVSKLKEMVQGLTFSILWSASLSQQR